MTSHAPWPEGFHAGRLGQGAWEVIYHHDRRDDPVPVEESGSLYGYILVCASGVEEVFVLHQGNISEREDPSRLLRGCGVDELREGSAPVESGRGTDSETVVEKTGSFDFRVGIDRGD